MKYILKPTLEDIALVKVVVILWNQDDIRALLNELSFPLSVSDRTEKWQDIEFKVILKVLQLPQPKLLTKKMLGFISPIGTQILNWMKHHADRFFNIKLPNELCWTPQGTVDRKRTAEMLVKDDNLDIITRYKLACVYCLEDCVSEMWNELPQRKKESFYNENFPTEKKFSRLHNLVVFFTYGMKREMARMEGMIEKILLGRHSQGFSPYRYAFGHAADCGNKVAVEYFLQKLTPGERVEAMFWAAKFVKARLYDCYRNPHTYIPKEYYVEVLCFFLSELEGPQQEAFIREYTYEVLKSFLDWPWQTFFMETTNQVWEFLHVMDYDCLLELIIHKEVNGLKDWDYRELFRELWTQSPDTHKNYCIGRCASGNILSDLFKMDDEENVKLILKSATVKDKEEIIFSYHGKNICESLVHRNKPAALKFFLRECISSKNVMIKFKNEFEDHIKLRHKKEKLVEEADVWNKFFQLLDDLSSSLS